MKQILIAAAALGGFVLLLVGMEFFIKGPPEDMPSVCPVIIFEDGTWVEEGWDSSKGFPPVGCVLTVRVQAKR